MNPPVADSANIRVGSEAVLRSSMQADILDDVAGASSRIVHFHIDRIERLQARNRVLTGLLLARIRH